MLLNMLLNFSTNQKKLSYRASESFFGTYVFGGGMSMVSDIVLPSSVDDSPESRIGSRGLASALSFWPAYSNSSWVAVLRLALGNNC